MRRQKINYNTIAEAAERIKKKNLALTITHLCSEMDYQQIDLQILELLEEWCRHQQNFQHSVLTPLYQSVNLETLQHLKNQINIENSFRMVRSTLESVPDAVMVMDQDWNIVDWNQNFIELWRIPSHFTENGFERILFEYLLEQVEDPAAIINAEYFHKKRRLVSELLLKDGRIFEQYARPHKLGDKINGRVYSFRDITQKRQDENTLRVREQAIAASMHGILIIDIQKDGLPIIYHNKAFEEMTGYPDTDILDKGFLNISGLQNELLYKRVRLAIQKEKHERIEFEAQRQNGEIFCCELSLSPVRDSFHKIRHYLCLVTELPILRSNTAQITKLALYDALTALPNQTLLMDRFRQLVLHTRRKKAELALLYLDLDQFKKITDTYEKTLGDKILQFVAQRLLAITKDYDSIARMGSDEFVILLGESCSLKDAEAKGNAILALLEKPFQIDNHRIVLSASMGVSCFPQHGKDFETLLKKAELSMYHAKDRGRNTCCVFNQEMQYALMCEMHMESSLRDALRENEFYLVYQPVVDLKREKLIGFEALIRWQSRKLGNVPPLDFIHVAEEKGMIIPIGQWVMEQACRQIALWHQKKCQNLSIAVNISERQLRQKDFVGMIESIILKTGISPHCLELEISERILSENIKETLITMHKIKDLGVRLVIDDFGTGYSSLAYLKQFPVDRIKIDRSYVNELNGINGDAPIARAIIGFGHALNLTVLAEGIETELQRNFMTAHGCDYAQGFYFQAPVRAEEIEQILNNTILGNQ